MDLHISVRRTYRMFTGFGIWWSNVALLVSKFLDGSYLRRNKDLEKTDDFLLHALIFFETIPVLKKKTNFIWICTYHLWQMNDVYERWSTWFKEGTPEPMLNAVSPLASSVSSYFNIKVFWINMAPTERSHVKNKGKWTLGCCALVSNEWNSRPEPFKQSTTTQLIVYGTSIVKALVAALIDGMNGLINEDIDCFSGICSI